jgi:hypothetical protein
VRAPSFRGKKISPADENCDRARKSSAPRRRGSRTSGRAVSTRRLGSEAGTRS